MNVFFHSQRMREKWVFICFSNLLFLSLLSLFLIAFAKGFGATLSPLRDVPQGVRIGQRIAMSDKDVKKINHLYECGRDLRRDNIITSLIRLIIDVRNK